MAYVDGTIYINSVIETDGFKVGGREVEAAARRMARSVRAIGESTKIALQKQTDAFVKQNQAYAQQEQKVKALADQILELLNQKVETTEFAEIGKQIDKDTTKLRQLEKAQEEFLAVGGKADSSAYKRREMQAEELRMSIENAKNEQNQLLSTGSAYKKPDTSAMEQKLFTEQQKLVQMNNALGTSYESLKAKVQSYGGVTENLVGTKSRMVKILGSLSSKLKSTGTAMLGLFKKTKKSNRSFGSSLKTILKYSLGIRSLYILVNKLRSALVDGFQNLAQYSKSTNASISSIKSALTQLKNSFATAFDPILTVVSPILTGFINLISKAVTYVGMFIAALTGQKSFTKAVAVQEDYAAGLANTASNAKDAEKALEGYLSPIDEINKYETKDTSSGTSGSGGVSVADMFETVPIESSIKGIADKIKDLLRAEDWKGLGAYVGSGINSGLQKVYDAINWNNVGPKVTYFVNAFTSTFNSLADNINWALLGATIGAGINTLVNTLNLGIDGIDWLSLGLALAVGLMGIVDEIDWSNLGRTIVKRFMVTWNVLYGFVSNLDYRKIGKALGDGINGALQTFDLTIILGGISALVIGLLNGIAEVARTTDWTLVGQKIAEGLKAVDWAGIASGLFDAGSQLIGGLLEAFGELPLPVQIAAAAIAGFFAALEVAPIISGIISLLTGGGGIVSAIGAVVSALGGPLTVAIGAGIAILTLLITNWDKVKSTMQKFDDWLQGVFSHDWTKEFGVLGDTVNAFLYTVNGVWDGIKTIFNGFITFFKGAFSGNWRQAWEGVKQIFSGIWQSMVAVVNAPINSIIGSINGLISAAVSGLNAVIDALNSIHFSVPDWVPVFGGYRFDLDLAHIRAPKIPYLATGAVIPPNAPFMAMLGDQKNGNNLEMPESLLRRVIREESRKGSGGSYRFVGQINRRVLFDEFITEAKLRQSATGKNPLELT